MSDTTEPTTKAPSRFDARSLYIYTVCLICAVVALVATVQLLRSIVELVWPDPNLGTYEKDLSARRLIERSAQREHALDVVSALVMLLVSVPGWLFHWRRAQAGRPR